MPRRKSLVEKSRLNLEISTKVREQLERLRIRTEADSLVEVIRRALGVYEYVVEAQRGKSRIIFRNGTQEEEKVFL